MFFVTNIYSMKNELKNQCRCPIKKGTQVRIWKVYANNIKMNTDNKEMNMR